jgi:biotin carboxyl carrier protein
MKYVTTIDDQSYQIEIITEDEITADGKRHTVDFQSVIGPPVVSLILDSQSYEAYVNPTEAGLEVLLRGQRYLVNVEDERKRILRDVSGTKAIQRDEIQLKSPMPGLIVAVPVEEGQQVDKGDNLVILESMKMQNEIKAPREGKVTGVRVNPGDNVDQNQVLVVIN